MRALSVLIALAVPAIVGAQGIIIPRCPPVRPDRPIVECLPMRGQVVRSRSDVKVELRDRVLRYEVEERFVNRGGLIGEADYVFPLPKGAAFRDLKLSIDGQMVAGETMSAAEARRIYEEIVRRQKDPALVEWMGHGLLRTRIFPIQPGEERRVVVRFESVAEREGDAVRVDYFRGTAPQGPAVWGAVSERSERPAQTADPRPQTQFTLTYRAGGELGEAYSPTHELDVERDEAVRRVSIRGGSPDVTVLVTLRHALAASVALLTNATRDQQGFALITVTPPTDLASTGMSRDVTFVIDVSGSMSGRKLEQAKAAGRQLLRTLTDRDRFRVIDFSTDVRSFRDDFAFATEANVRAAVRYLDDLDASGSTNISGALEEALREPAGGRRQAAGERMSLVLFMTDGSATVGERDPTVIATRAARLRGDARVFSFGLGADVNIGLIEQLALEGRGTASFLRPEENPERAVELLATRLRQPMLTDVRISIEGDDVRLSRMYPSGQLDVFAGQDLVVLGRYEGSGTANVVVRGRAGGREVRWASQRNFPREERENAFVPRLWATQRLGWLAAEKRRNGGSSEVDDEIRQLGERYGIPTEFTSYLVLEPGMRVADMQQRLQGREMRLNDVVVTGAAVGGAGAFSSAGASSAPAAEAFERAKKASGQRDAKTMAAVDSTLRADLGSSVRRSGSRLFKLEADRWLDVTAKPGLQVYKVKAYSRSYFTLLERIPELRETFMMGDKLLVAGKGVAIEVVDDAPELTESDMQRIVKGW